MTRTLIQNAILVNEGKVRKNYSIIIENGLIAEILAKGKAPSAPCDETIDATGCYLLPGVIDDHVHFRDPGLTPKADILTESCAAAAGGVTSIMDMPNTKPQTITLKDLEEKQRLMEEKCVVNYSCYFGATRTNYDLFPQLDAKRVCGIKLFMGSSTGDMLVDKMESLRQIFNGTDLLIAAHCEDNEIIKKQIGKHRSIFSGQDDIPLIKHPYIRSAKACYVSSQLAIKLATEAGARLHVLHISTADEIPLFSNTPLSPGKKITAEVCVPHLLFCKDDYLRLGARIKCNPAIKQKTDRDALRAAINTERIDVIATDHAPHLWSEKQGGALTALSGMPMVQFSLISMLELVDKNVLPIETVVEKMCHAPAKLFNIDKRGYIRPGYHADLVLVRPKTPWKLTRNKILSKCAWSPLEGHTFDWKVEKTFVNGHLIYDGENVNVDHRGEALLFNR